MYAASTQTYNTPVYDHKVGSNISSDQYIHDFENPSHGKGERPHTSVDNLHSDIIPVDFRAVAGTIILSQNDK